jgi:hypothetical protein
MKAKKERREKINSTIKESTIDKSQLIEWLILQYLGKNEKKI